MSARERLESYLHSLRVRLRTHIYARAAAIAIGGVLAITAFTVWTLQQREFSPAITITGRVAIIACHQSSVLLGRGNFYSCRKSVK